MQLSKIGIHDKYSVVHQHRHCACVVPRRPSSSVPSLAVKLPSRSRRPLPLCRALHHPLFAIAAHRRPSPLCSRSLSVREPLRHCCRGAVGSRRPCRPTTPATCHAPPRPFVRMVVALPLLTLSLRHRILCLSSVRLVVAYPCFSRRHLPSASTSASHRAVTSCHAPLGPLVQLVKASPLLTLPEDRA